MPAVQAGESVVDILEVQDLLALAANHVVERITRCTSLLAAGKRGRCGGREGADGVVGVGGVVDGVGHGGGERGSWCGGGIHLAVLAVWGGSCRWSEIVILKDTVLGRGCPLGLRDGF